MIRGYHPKDEPTLQAIVLAAGAATRFGSPKQLALLDGRPMLQGVVARAVEVMGQAVTVVLGAYAVQIAPILVASSARIVINPAWQKGIASSIRSGIDQLPANCAGAMLLLGDQCAIRAVDLKQLATAWRRHPDRIVAAEYAATVGVPAIFPRTSFAALMSLQGDQGAQAILREQGSRVLRIPLAHAALDVDKPKDLSIG